MWTCGHGSKYLLYYFIYFSGKSPSVGQCLISLNLTRTKAHTQNCKNQDTFPLWHALHRSLDCQHLKKLLLDFQISVRVSLKFYSPKLTLFKFSDELISCSYSRILNLHFLWSSPKYLFAKMNSCNGTFLSVLISINNFYHLEKQVKFWKKVSEFMRAYDELVEKWLLLNTWFL